MTVQNISPGTTTAPSWASHIAGLRAMLDLLIAAAIGAASEPNKAHRLMRLIRSTARAVMNAEAAFYQRQLKSKMLKDAAWRGRVYAELGGFHGMNRWRERFRRGVHAEHNDVREHCISSGITLDNYGANNADKPRPHTTVKTDSAGQFCLAPLPRGFTGRTRAAQPRTRGEQAFQSPLSEPIALHPNELSPPNRRSPPPHGEERRSCDDTQDDGVIIKKRPPDWKPP